MLTRQCIKAVPNGKWAWYKSGKGLPPICALGVYSAVQDKKELHKIEVITVNQKCFNTNFIDNIPLEKPLKLLNRNTGGFLGCCKNPVNKIYL